MEITVIGSGYVGLTTGACISDFGHAVTCVDLSEEKIDALKSGTIPFYEPDLSSVIDKNVQSGNLTFTTDLSQCVPWSDIIFLAVGTPVLEDGSADMSMLYKAVNDLIPYLSNGMVVAIKSTVPVGTNAKVREILDREYSCEGIAVVSNPEFLRQGTAVDDFRKPSRVVIGSDYSWASHVVYSLYSPFVSPSEIIVTDPATAEIIKYTANTMLAVRLSTMNQIAWLCERVGADIDVVSCAVGLDPRIGKQFLKSGPGYGGSCLPKDVQQLIVSGETYGVSQTVAASAHDANRQAVQHAYSKILEVCDGSVKDKTVTILGVTFKADTDDMREAPSMTIIPQLISAGATVKAVDPTWRTQAQHKLPQNVKWYDDAYVASYDSDVIVVLTDWNCFLGLDLKEISSRMRMPRMVDLRNIYNSEKVIADGFLMYGSIGKQTVAV